LFAEWQFTLLCPNWLQVAWSSAKLLFHQPFAQQIVLSLEPWRIAGGYLLPTHPGLFLFLQQLIPQDASAVQQALLVQSTA